MQESTNTELECILNIIEDSRHTPFNSLSILVENFKRLCHSPCFILNLLLYWEVCITKNEQSDF